MSVLSVIKAVFYVVLLMVLAPFGALPFLVGMAKFYSKERGFSNVVFFLFWLAGLVVWLVLVLYWLFLILEDLPPGSVDAIG